MTEPIKTSHIAGEHHHRYRHGYCQRGRRCPEHWVWTGMRQRCSDPTCKSFCYYGGRGICVCERWDLFINFLADMGQRPDGMSIDRIDNDGDYCPENCRWATRTEQNRNTRQCHKLTVYGETLTLSRWSEISGVPMKTISVRVLGTRGKRGNRPVWPPKAAVFAPSGTKLRDVERDFPHLAEGEV